MTSLSTTTLESDRGGEIPGTIAALVLLPALAGATLAHGCVSAEARAAWTAFVCAVGCAGIGAMLFRGTHVRLTAGSIPLLLFIGFAFFQTLPLGVELSGPARDATGLTRSAAISWIPAATLSHGRQWIALFVLFVLGALVFAHPGRMRHLPWTLLLLGSVLSFYYAIHPFLAHVPGHVTIDGEGAFTRHVFGTYLNRNHVAAFLAMAIVMGIGLFISRHRTLYHRSAGFSRRQGYIAAMIVLSLVGLLLTQSRGGMANLVAGVVVLPLLTPRRSARVPRWIPLLGALGLVAALPFALPREFVARFLDIGHDLTAAGARGDVWQSAWDLYALSPVIGHGLGTFGDVAAITQSPDVLGHLEHAHCDPLQFLSETGVFGFNFLLWTGVVFAIHVVRRCRRTRGDRRTILAAATVAALVGMVVQSFVDFNAQIPALAAWTALTAGAASGAMANANGLPPSGFALPRWLLPPAMIALGLTAVFAGRESWSYQAQHAIPPGTAHEEVLRRLSGSEHIHACRGEAASRAAWLTAIAEETPRDVAAIRQHASRALRINPFDARAWRAMALADIWSGDENAGESLYRATRLTPPGDRVELRIELGMRLLGANRAKLARIWFRELFEDPGIDAMRIIRRLYAEDALGLDLVPLYLDEPRAAMRKLADGLLHQGELYEREKVLDLLLERAPDRNRFTIRDDAILVGKKIRESRDEAGHRIHVELTLDTPIGYEFDSQMMCLNLRGEHAVIEHYFRPVRGVSGHVVPIPEYTPPGGYELTLQSYTNGARFPLSFVRIEERGLHLTPGRSVPAAGALYRELARPAARKAKNGLRLERGTRLWRRIRLSSPGGTLVISHSSSSPIVVRFNDTILHRVNTPVTGENGLDSRYRLPAPISEGLLEITLDGEAATDVLRVTLLAEPVR